MVATNKSRWKFNDAQPHHTKDFTLRGTGIMIVTNSKDGVQKSMHSDTPDYGGALGGNTPSFVLLALVPYNVP